MKIFVDASALVAMIMGEPGSDALTLILEETLDRLSSPLAEWESVLALCRSHDVPLDIARDRVRGAIAVLDLRIVAIGERETIAALDAYERYGKGRHPAKLNMGDCFAYACAKANNAKLLYKGDDFSKTDLA
ncbi:type II toxin-antitoxin system VapC family toxin [Sphingomonas sp. BIUV-7]|uniref:Type II toxin-antitoxin system VapC family toxin n=1 Tax=Sphingomonas natans TaxID=3063330 RepID=A0ABT8Y3A9_9SPHN|nr:type II toxin-antitoxin system VapC family toxin [Sphingomonas sp. BIUV-7]MDO6412791.1 type II toxin-antitoxin system VapC family toxin [Sphingomonas sp. BIUV-7]